MRVEIRAADLPRVLFQQASATGAEQRRAFGALLRATRKGTGLRQVEVATQANLSFWRLSRLERGLVRPTTDDVRALARVFPGLQVALAPNGTPTTLMGAAGQERQP
jgi:transcriptional regulator with XRE-family HTH domain